MKYPFMKRTLVGLLFPLFLICSSAFAEDPRLTAAYHCEYGLKLLNDAKIDLAVERFAKAFLLDPQNKTAKDSLKTIVSDQLVTYSQGLKIMRFIDQVEYLDFLLTRYTGLTEENAQLLSSLRKNTDLAKDVNLAEKFRGMEEKIAGKTVSLPRMALITFAGDQSSSFDVGELTTLLSRERQELTKEVGFWEEQNDELRSLRKAIFVQKSPQSSPDVISKIKSERDEFQKRITEKDQLLTVQQENLEYFKAELESVRANFTILQDKFKETDSKISDLTNRIASMSVELFEKNKIIGESQERAENLQKELTIAYEKATLAQKIIQEKDEQTRDRIIDIEVQNAELTYKNQMLVQDLQTKNIQLSALQDLSNQKDMLTNEYRSAFMSTDEKANQLIGMVEIYRTKLIETKQALTAKENELKQLHSVLFDLDDLPVKQSKKPAGDSLQNQEAAAHYDFTSNKMYPSKTVLQAR